LSEYISRNIVERRVWSIAFFSLFGRLFCMLRTRHYYTSARGRWAQGRGNHRRDPHARARRRVVNGCWPACRPTDARGRWFPRWHVGARTNARNPRPAVRVQIGRRTCRHASFRRLPLDRERLDSDTHMHARSSRAS
jgi:hypothetical protein